MKTGVQNICNYLNRLDSGLRRNDGCSGFRLEFIPHEMRGRNDKKWHFPTFYESINIENLTRIKGKSTRHWAGLHGFLCN